MPKQDLTQTSGMFDKGDIIPVNLDDERIFVGKDANKVVESHEDHGESDSCSECERDRQARRRN